MPNQHTGEDVATTFLLAYKQPKCNSVTDFISLSVRSRNCANRLTCQDPGIAVKACVVFGQSLITIWKSIPPSLRTTTHPQQTPLTGAFYERGRLLFQVAWNQIYGNTSTSVFELLRKYFEIKQLSRCQTWDVKTRHRPEMGVGVWKRMGGSAVRLTVVLNMHQSFKQFKLSWTRAAIYGLCDHKELCHACYSVSLLLWCWSHRKTSKRCLLQ